MSLFINVMRDSIYKGERVKKSDGKNESEPPHAGIADREGGGAGAAAGGSAVGDGGCKYGR